MEMDTFRGVSILHFLSMITPQYHHIFFILWNSLSFSSVPKVKTELDRMEKLGVISKVHQPTEWCS